MIVYVTYSNTTCSCFNLSLPKNKMPRDHKTLQHSSVPAHEDVRFTQRALKCRISNYRINSLKPPLAQKCI